MGTSVALSGDTIVAGAPGADVGSHVEQGAVYVFSEPRRGWSGTVHSSAKLTAPAGGTASEFGTAVAVSGSTVAVGAAGASVRGHSTQGEAFVFARPRRGWAERVARPAALIAPHGAAGDDLGASVAAWGSMVAVGAPGAGNSCPNFGSGYIELYKRPHQGWRGTLDPAGTLSNQNADEPEQLGYSLAVGNDTIFSGEPYPCVQDDSQQNAGGIAVFPEPRGGWSGQHKDPAVILTAGYASLGQNFAVDGDTLIAPVAANTAVNYTGVIDSPAAALVFIKAASGWRKAGGPTVIHAPESERAPGAPNAFALRGDSALWGTTVLSKPVAGWAAATPAATLSTPAGTADDLNGFTSAMSGRYVFALTNEYGGTQHVLVFKEPAQGWSSATQVAELAFSGGIPGGLDALSIAASGSTVVVGARVTNSLLAPTGVAYVFSEPPGGWTGVVHEAATLTPSDAGATTGGAYQFGVSVAVSGSTVFVGSPSDQVGTNPSQGAVYAYNEPPGGWAGNLTESAKLTVMGGASYDSLGSSLAASGQTVVAGAPAIVPPDGGISSAYLFTEPASGWTGSVQQTARLEPQDQNRALEPIVGFSLATEGSTVVEGAPLASINGEGELIYVFNEPSTGWSGTLAPSATLSGAEVETSNNSGLLAISGTTLIAGAPGSPPTPAAITVFHEPARGWTGQIAPTTLLSPRHAIGLNGVSDLALTGDTAAITTGAGTYVLKVGAP